MNTCNKNGFKTGFWAGVAVTAVGLFSFAMSKRGAKLTAEMQKDIEALLEKGKARLKEMKGDDGWSFDRVMDQLVAEYAEKKEMSREVKEKVLAELKKRWEEMKRGEDKE